MYHSTNCGMGKHARAFQKRVATSQIACRKDPATDTQIS